jgi:hypothetical protein
MKNPYKQLSVPVLALACIFAGCSQPSQNQGHTGFPVRIGIQGQEPLPVHLHSDVDNTLMVEFKPSPVTLPVKLQVGPNEPLPVALLLENGQLLPIKINSDVNSPFPVSLQVQSDTPLPVVLNITKPLPVEINVPSNIILFAGASLAAILITCIVISLSRRQK